MNESIDERRAHDLEVFLPLLSEKLGLGRFPVLRNPQNIHRRAP
jgi:hypothetical protein